MIGQGERRTRFLVAYGYAVVAALVVLSQALGGPVGGSSPGRWLYGFAVAAVFSLVPAWLARHLPGPLWLTPVVLGLGIGAALFPALAFIVAALR